MNTEEHFQLELEEVKCEGIDTEQEHDTEIEALPQSDQPTGKISVISRNGEAKHVSQWVNRSRRDSKVGNVIITVKNAHKSYGTAKKRVNVLQNFNMVVNGATIYSLLGASGCGKTTILSCFVGLTKIDSGYISVLGFPPGTKNSGIPGKRIGFMPQETALFGMFTIKETLQYYAKLYGLSNQDFQENFAFITKLLQLCRLTNEKVETLSGGQRRRVSFAIALIHNPELIILDEPTVGVDPILRESIWKYLRQLVASDRVTILITTHYHDEAKYSDKVGFMRNGRLLLENSPDEFLLQYQGYTLEQCILRACQENESEERHKETGLSLDTLFSNSSSKDKLKAVNGLYYKEKSPDIHYQNQTKNISPEFKNQSSTANLFKRDSLPDSNIFYKSNSSKIQEKSARIYWLIRKNFTAMMRNIGFMLFIFLIPSLHIAAICLAVGNDPTNMKFGVINQEVDSPSWDCLSPLGCTTENLSCRYLHEFSTNSLNLIKFSDEKEAIEKVHDGSLWGYLVFPQNFSALTVERGAHGISATLEAINGSQIFFHLDMTNSQIGNTIRKLAFEAFQRFSKALLTDCGSEPSLGNNPINFEHTIYGTVDTNYREFFAPSIVIGFLFFFPLCSSGIQYITEKKLGITKRSIVAGVTTLEIMMSYLITQAIVLLVQCTSAIFILTYVFKIGVTTNVVWAVVLAILVGMCGVSMGFCCSTLCKEELEAVLLAIGSFFPNFLLSGMVWPVQGMPVYLQYVSYILPCSFACESMRAILSKGYSITHPVVWPGFASIITWIIIFWILTFIIDRFISKNK